ncbi:protein of unknown function [Tenacibaculum sp. MAR_2009_124]|uniref:DUF1737 domain-containing protein n=1 Tax=Tenacibaculum sp. MAR_2009_124 TaxID=1250059 RepID=UPI000895A646|nr:DUF1737 domain-containing protein [Tenacibaculum sp. MAR_2009_124]SEC64695.1 protein of unknown function [Tenacibaculum sp. MAR_2009_124]
MEYKILKGRDVQHLEMEVSNYINKGWKPLGGFSSVIVPKTISLEGYELLQPMLKE